MTKVKKNAPYLYLTQDKGKEEYYLFLAIPIEEGYDLMHREDISPVWQADGTTVVDVSIKKGNNRTHPVFHQSFTIDPADAPANFRAEHNAIKVKISVLDEQDGEEQVLQSIIQYRDRDGSGALQHLDKEAGIAYNRPYIYCGLNKEGIENEIGDGLVFDPYVLMWLKGYRFRSDRFQMTGPENGVCETFIVLSNMNVNDQSISFKDDFRVNEEFYLDRAPAEGNFTATIILEDNVPGPSSLADKTDEEFSRALKQLELDRLRRKEERRKALAGSADASKGDQGDKLPEAATTEALSLPDPEEEEDQQSETAQNQEEQTTETKAKTRNMSILL